MSKGNQRAVKRLSEGYQRIQRAAKELSMRCGRAVKPVKGLSRGCQRAVRAVTGLSEGCQRAVKGLSERPRDPKRPPRARHKHTSDLSLGRPRSSVEPMQNHLRRLVKLDPDAPNILCLEHPCSVLTADAMDFELLLAPGRASPKQHNMPGHRFV